MRHRWSPGIGFHFGVQPWQMDDLRPVELDALEASVKQLEKGSR